MEGPRSVRRLFRGRRAYRWVGVGAILLVGLLAALDVIALQVFQARGGVQIARTMAAERASLDLGGLPFLPGYLRGRVEKVEVEVIGATARGLRVASLQARFTDARLDASDVFGLLRTRYANRTAVRGTDVFARVEIVEDDLEVFAISQEPRVDTLRIRSSGVEVVFAEPDLDGEDGAGDDEEGDEEGPTARFLPRVEDRRLVLKAVGRAGLSFEFREAVERIEGIIDLPRVPKGLQTDVQLGNGVFTLEAFGPSIELEIGEGGSDAFRPRLPARSRDG